MMMLKTTPGRRLEDAFNEAANIGRCVGLELQTPSLQAWLGALSPIPEETGVGYLIFCGSVMLRIGPENLVPKRSGNGQKRRERTAKEECEQCICDFQQDSC